MSEMLIGIVMIASLSIVCLGRYRQPQTDHYYFLNDYHLVQSEAMKQRKEMNAGQGVRFNSMGHIDLARTLRFGNKEITLNLGNGYALIK